MEDSLFGGLFGFIIGFIIAIFIGMGIESDTIKNICENIIADELKKECKIIDDDCWCTDDQKNWYIIGEKE